MADLALGDVRSHRQTQRALAMVSTRSSAPCPAPHPAVLESAPEFIWLPMAVLSPWDCHIGTDWFCLGAGYDH